MKYDVKISKLRNDGPIKAFASVNLDKEFAITGLKVMEGSKGVFVAMPSYKTNKGDYQDIFFPITKESRQALNDAVLNAYQMEIDRTPEYREVQEEHPFEQQMNGM